MLESFSHCDGVSIDHQEKKEQIKKPEETLDSILSVELNVENINSYAGDAFNKLVSFADKKVADYRKIESVGNLSYTEIEDAAFKYYGLESINSILDYIADKSKEIRDLDKIINSADKIDNVIVQPDVVSQNISNNGNGEFKEKRMIDRLKTVLFVLKEDFGVDLNDEANFKIQKGIVNKNMMRKTSYYLINASAINRTILICDEDGNASYVFDSKKISEKNINNNSLINYTKSELNDLLKEDPEIGRRVVYSKEGFVPRIIDAIEKPVTNLSDTTEYLSENSYFYFKMPEDYRTLSQLSKEIGIDSTTLRIIIKSIDKADFGSICKYRIPKGPAAIGFSPEQIKIILEDVKSSGKLKDTALMPDGYFSIATVAEDSGISLASIYKAVNELEVELGEIGEFHYPNSAKNVRGLSLEQKDKVLKYLERKGILVEKVKDGYLTETSFIKKYGFNRRLVKKIIEEINPKIGEIKKARVNSNVVFVYSPEQQQMILDYMKNTKNINEMAPINFLRLATIAKKNGINPKLVASTVEELKDHLGEIRFYRFPKGIAAYCYSPEQQQMILDKLEQEGKLKKAIIAPDGYLPATVLAKKFHISCKDFSFFLEDIKDDLGTVDRYIYGTKVALGYSNEQQKIIMDKLIEKGKYIEEIPDGYLNIFNFSKINNIDRHMVSRVISELGDQFRDLLEQKGKILSPEQQQIILEKLSADGILNIPKASTEILAITALSKKYHVNTEVLTEIIETVKDKLGKIKRYKFGNHSNIGYCLEQQQIIENELKRQGKILEKAPDNYLTIRGLARKYGITNRSIITATIETIKDELGEMKKYLPPKKGPGVFYCSPKQQKIIIDYINNHKKK